MKSRASIWTSMFMLGFLTLGAQYQYQLTLSSASYQEQSGGNPAYDPSGWGNFEPHQINLGFSFDFMDTTVNAVTLEATGRLVFDPAHHYWLDMTTVANFESKPGINTSPISIHHNTLGDGSKLVRIQYKNATYKDDATKTINFSITLYEKDNAIELHMGPRDDVSGSNAVYLGPYLGYYHSSAPAQANFDFGRNWTGDFPNLDDTTFYGTQNNFLNFTLNELAPENQIVRLEPLTSVTIPEEEEHARVYFDATKKMLHVETLSELELQLKNSSGQAIWQTKNASSPTDLSFLKPGCYILLALRNGQVISTQKICAP